VLDQLAAGGQARDRALREQPDRSGPRPLNARLRPMRGLKRLRSTAVIAVGRAFLQNVRRGFYERGLDVRHKSGLQRRSPSSRGRSDRGSASAHPRPNPSNATAPGGLRRELLDRILIVNLRQLQHVLATT
jgi:hypothetical protein